MFMTMTDKKLKLTTGQFAIVDSEDFDFLNKFKWYFDEYYVMRSATFSDGINRKVFMHRLLLGLQHGDKRQGDHRNRNRLDYRRQNLRVVGSRENNWNRNPQPGGYSKFKGVSWDKGRKQYVARITSNHKGYFLGWFNDELAAARAYNEAALIYHGEYARLNEVNHV